MIRVLRYVFGCIYETGLIWRTSVANSIVLWMGVAWALTMYTLCIVVAGLSEGKIRLLLPVMVFVIIPMLIIWIMGYVYIIRNDFYKTFVHTSRFQTLKAKLVGYILFFLPLATPFAGYFLADIVAKHLGINIDTNLPW